MRRLSHLFCCDIAHLSTVCARGSFPGSAPLFRGTRNCSIPFILLTTGKPATAPCCQKSTSDFDVSHDNKTWVDGYEAKPVEFPQMQVGVSFLVDTPVRPTMVRYTANKVFPQCAVYNTEGLPALPFQIDVSSFDVSAAEEADESNHSRRH